MAHDDHSAHHVNYLAVFAALCIFTGLSVLFDVLSFENRMITIVLVLAIAVAKAMSVMMFFMHLKFEGNWKFVLLAPTTILAIGLPIALLPDIGVKYYTTLAPQDGVWGAEMEELDAAHHGGEHSKSEDVHAAPADDHEASEADANKA